MNGFSRQLLFWFKVSCCIILSLRKGEVTVSLLQFAQYISHADLCKFLPQRFASDLAVSFTPLTERQTRGLNPNLHRWTGSNEGRLRGMAFSSDDVTGLAVVRHT